MGDIEDEREKRRNAFTKPWNLILGGRCRQRSSSLVSIALSDLSSILICTYYSVIIAHMLCPYGSRIVAKLRRTPYATLHPSLHLPGVENRLVGLQPRRISCSGVHLA